MKKFSIVLLTVFFSSASSAQQTPFKSEFSFAGGKYRVKYYADSIIKLTFYPDDYKTDENLSDAVILKTPPGFSAQDIRISGDSVFFNNKLLISGTYHTNRFRGFRFHLNDNEMVFGAGERALPLNRRGYRLNLYNGPWYGYGEGADNLNYSVPFITSSNGYGLFFDNASTGYLDIGKADKNILEYGATSGELNVFIILGGYQQVLQSYYKLTGTQPLPPRWALGNIMSRFGYTSEQQTKSILSKMQAENIPVDAIVFDLFWFGDSIKGTMGNLDWVNKKKWPDPKRMISDFKRAGINTILITEPFVVETARTFKESKPYHATDSSGIAYLVNDFYFGKAGLIDIFRKDAQKWFWLYHKKQMNNGVEAWWGDLGEPEKHPPGIYHNLKDYGYKRLFSADEVHNIYGHTWTKMLYQNYATEYPLKRLFSLNRSGFAGTQHYGIFPWTGDVSRSWSGLRAQLPVLLGMSMSGVPYVHSDAGGFAGGDGDNELYVRWLQFAAFTPVFRPHGTALYEIEKSAFSFPSEAALIDTPYRQYAEKAIRTRYALLPYNYSLAYQQSKNGSPLMSPLYYYFSNDTTAVKVQDEFMWGTNILVVPVLEKSAQTRKYYLPKGKWFHMSQYKFLQGSTWQIDTVELKEIPVLLKEGSFLVVNGQAHVGNTSTYKGDSLSVMYVTSNNPSVYELYNDDGATKESIEKKMFELITFTSTAKKGNELGITITSDNGKYPGKPAKRSILFSIPMADKKPFKIFLNNKLLTVPAENSPGFKEGNYFLNEEQNIVFFPIWFTGREVRVRVAW